MKSPIVFAAVLASGMAGGQTLIPGLGLGGSLALIPGDSMILDLGEPRNDLPCSVTPGKPELGFDFKFHFSYQVSIPVREFAGAEDRLTILFRVISENHQDAPVYFVQKTRVPVLEDDAKGFAKLEGAFLLGEGKYHVDWLMRDLRERVCARSWDVEARVNPTDASMSGDIAHGLIEPVEATLFADELHLESDQHGPQLNVTVIVNFAPQDLRASILGEADLRGLLAILRKIAREPRIGRYSVVACSLRAQRVIYHQDNLERIELPALGKALQSISFASVNVKQLAIKDGETEFLAKLTMDELKSDHLDGLIFVSPKCPLGVDVPRAVTDRLREFNHPVFYLNYNREPSSFPWRDAIGQVVKRLRGSEYTISRPQDLANAWSQVVSRMVRSHGLDERQADAAVTVHGN